MFSTLLKMNSIISVTCCEEKKVEEKEKKKKKKKEKKSVDETMSVYVMQWFPNLSTSSLWSFKLIWNGKEAH